MPRWSDQLFNNIGNLYRTISAFSRFMYGVFNKIPFEVVSELKICRLRCGHLDIKDAQWDKKMMGTKFHITSYRFWAPQAHQKYNFKSGQIFRVGWNWSGAHIVLVILSTQEIKIFCCSIQNGSNDQHKYMYIVYIYIYILIRYWVALWFCLFVRYRNHFPVIHFQN